MRACGRGVSPERLFEDDAQPLAPPSPPSDTIGPSGGSNSYVGDAEPSRALHRAARPTHTPTPPRTRGGRILQMDPSNP